MLNKKSKIHLATVSSLFNKLFDSLINSVTTLRLSYGLFIADCLLKVELTIIHFGMLLIVESLIH